MSVRPDIDDVSAGTASKTRAERAPSRRALWALGALAAGLVLGRWLLPEASVMFAVCALLLIVAGATRGRACAAALLLGVSALGAGWYTLRTVCVEPGHLRLWAGEHGVAGEDEEAPEGEGGVGGVGG